MVDNMTRPAGAAGAPIAVEVRVENLAPANGSILTAAWFGFHDGSFDVHDMGAGASEVLERLAEEGNPVPVMGCSTPAAPAPAPRRASSAARSPL